MKKLFCLGLLLLSACSNASNVQYVKNWRIEHDTAYTNFSSLKQGEELVIECQLGTVSVNTFDPETGLELSSNDPNTVVVVGTQYFSTLRSDEDRKRFYLSLSKKGVIQLIDGKIKSKSHSLTGLKKEIDFVEWDLSDCKE